LWREGAVDRHRFVLSFPLVDHFFFSPPFVLSPSYTALTFHFFPLIGISSAYDGPLSSLEILHTLTPSSRLSVVEAIEHGILDLHDPLPEETLKSMADEVGGKVKWLEREVVSALYTEDRETEELARLERIVELPSRWAVLTRRCK
jgi:hypothetical protein